MKIFSWCDFDSFLVIDDEMNFSLKFSSRRSPSPKGSMHLWKNIAERLLFSCVHEALVVRRPLKWSNWLRKDIVQRMMTKHFHTNSLPMLDQRNGIGNVHSVFFSHRCLFSSANERVAPSFEFISQSVVCQRSLIEHQSDSLRSSSTCSCAVTSFVLLFLQPRVYNLLVVAFSLSFFSASSSLGNTSTYAVLIVDYFCWEAKKRNARTDWRISLFLFFSIEKFQTSLNISVEKCEQVMRSLSLPFSHFNCRTRAHVDVRSQLLDRLSFQIKKICHKNNDDNRFKVSPIHFVAVADCL